MTRGTTRLVAIAAYFLLISIATRVGLALFSNEYFTLSEWARFMGIGIIFDLVVLPWFLLPWAVYDAVMPEFAKHRSAYKWEKRWAALWAPIYLSLFVVIGASEFTFWAEFNSRFDFIAVDYLIYTKEVINNILQSYPVALWMSGILGLSFLISWFVWPMGSIAKQSGWKTRWARVSLVAAVMGLGFWAVDQKLADTKSNKFVEQLSANGVYAFGHAFFNNELDYDKYYPRLSEADLNTHVRALVKQSNSEFTGPEGIERKVSAYTPPKKVNVVLVTIESFSAEYMGIFGNKMGLTPELDKLAKRGLLFTNLRATGTRTVRGLEALSVGTPPIPGQSIVRRPNNEGLKTLGGELKAKGWQPYWVYGGYGFFDNMNAYYGGNQYTVVDRVSVDEKAFPIHHETIWGIADEDIYSLAMTRFDREYEQGNRFFAQVMTTSNHRPYTFPKDRIDMVQKRRESVVKYTDWAIGDFMRRAAKKPWFDNTLFIFVSDHTAKAAGKTDLPPSRYLIPMIWYAPDLIKPGVMARLMSQIDVAPTLLGWLGLDYTSRFFGYDLFNLEAGRERAFISTYQKLGYLKGDRLVALDVNKPPVVTAGLPPKEGTQTSTNDQQLIKDAISWYQAGSLYFRTGQLKDKDKKQEPPK